MFWDNKDCLLKKYLVFRILQIVKKTTDNNDDGVDDEMGGVLDKITGRPEIE